MPQIKAYVEQCLCVSKFGKPGQRTDCLPSQSGGHLTTTGKNASERRTLSTVLWNSLPVQGRVDRRRHPLDIQRRLQKFRDGPGCGLRVA